MTGVFGMRKNIPWRERVVRDGDCLLWQGQIDSQGYSRLSGRLAHCVVYEEEVGPIPEGMQLDHECHNAETCAGGPGCLHRRCVNPAHLTPVTPRANVLKSNSVTALNVRKTHCKNGHEFTPENTHRRLDRRGRESRTCRACRRARKARNCYTRSTNSPVRVSTFTRSPMST
jgi:hypothetical protein